MPLLKSDTTAAIGANIRELQNSGRPHGQAVAIALHTADKVKHKRKGRITKIRVRPKKNRTTT